MTAVEAKVSLLTPGSQPDLYEPASYRVPPSDFVVSRNQDGTTASTYGDISWDRTPYSVDGRTRHLHFTYWTEGGLTDQRRSLLDEMRWVMFLIMYLRPGSPLSTSGLEGYLVTLRRLARIAEQTAVRLQDVFSDPTLLFHDIESSKNHAPLMASLLSFLKSLNPQQVGFEIAGRQVVKKLRCLSRDWSNAAKQHPPIPTRIYSLILAALSKELNDFECVAASVFSLYKVCMTDRFMGRDKARQLAIHRKRGDGYKNVSPTFPALLKQYGLEQYFAEKKFSKSVYGLSVALQEVMLVASFQIQAYTGMRRDEVLSLPYDCLETVVRDGMSHYIINGRVTKSSNGLAKKARWVTSSAGRRAILIAQSIANVIRSVHDPEFEKQETRYLFVSPLPRHAETSGKPTTLHLNVFVELRRRIQPIILEPDLQELENIDPHRAWRSEKAFKLDSPWVFTGHQLRRSLALYAQRSGLVSLPSLKRQLQHITHEMAWYYARGSAFANDFIGTDKGHFGREWQKAQPISQYLSFVAHVLMTDDTLFGAYSNWVDRRLRNSEGMVLIDRSATMRRFVKGELAYRETPIGGCINVDECDKTMNNVLEVACLTNHCKNLVGSLQKLNRVIAAQTTRVQKLKAILPSSPELRAEEEDLKILCATRDSVLGKSTQKGRSL